MKILFSVLALGILLALPAFVGAQTYQYIDTTGNLRMIVADNSEEAIANAFDRAPNSGVMLVSVAYSNNQFGVGGNPSTEHYKYVSILGRIMDIEAESSTHVLTSAPDIAPNSGVMEVSGTTIVPPTGSSVSL